MMPRHILYRIIAKRRPSTTHTIAINCPVPKSKRAPKKKKRKVSQQFITPTFDPIRCRTICQHSFQQFIRSVALAALRYPRSSITSFQSLNPGSTITISSRFDHSSANRDSSPFDPCHLCQIEIYARSISSTNEKRWKDKETERSKDGASLANDEW